MPENEKWPAASVEARLETEDGVCVLTYKKLDTQEVISSVGDDQAGATAVFIGTTRNSFRGETINDYTSIARGCNDISG